MFSPTVTELPRRLEAISPDSFAGTVHLPAPVADPRVLDNVVQLRPIAAPAYGSGLTAA
jgi:hypothetical protein